MQPNSAYPGEGKVHQGRYIPSAAEMGPGQIHYGTDYPQPEVIPALRPVETKETPTMQTARMITYILLWVTCIALLVTMAEMWHIALEAQKAMDAFREAFTNNGVFGN